MSWEAEYNLSPVPKPASSHAFGALVHLQSPPHPSLPLIFSILIGVTKSSNMQLQYFLAAGLALGAASARGLSIRGFQCQFSRKPPNSGATCESFAASWGASVTDFMKWNPGVTCPGLDTSKEYCVIGTSTDDLPTTTSSPSQKPSSLSSTTTRSSTTTPPVTTSVRPSTTALSSSFTTKSSTTTVPGNGVTTPLPIQDGMVGNCNKFHRVELGESCATIAPLYSISSAQFIQWNPAAKSDCSGLWGSTVSHPGLTMLPVPRSGPPGKISTPRSALTIVTPIVCVRRHHWRLAHQARKRHHDAHAAASRHGQQLQQVREGQPG